MPPEPDAEQAARAVEKVQQSHNQPIDAQRLPRWFAVAWGLYLFLILVEPDLLPMLHLERWSLWWLGICTVLTPAFLAAQYTRRGRRLLGISPGLQPQGLDPAMERTSWAIFLAVVGVAGVIYVGSTLMLPQAPPWRLLLGLALGLGAMIPPDRQLERLKRFGKRRTPGTDPELDQRRPNSGSNM